MGFERGFIGHFGWASGVGAALVVVACGAMAGSGCSFQRTVVPHGSERTMAPAPVLQDLVGGVTLTALQRALSGELGELEGKLVCVDVEDALSQGGVASREYIRAEVEARLAARGAHVACEPAATRVLVQVDRSGVDVVRSRTVEQQTVILYAGLAAVAGGMLAMGLDPDALYADDPTQSATMISLGSVAGLADLLLWWLAPPVRDALTLDAQSAVRIHLLPPPSAGAPRVMEGEASRQLVISDERARVHEYGL